ncbi:MAG: hypothetical protein JW810_10850 [Sedimentisphaerales bacterium]|nr:hypothetical protein [Sedimentisphaerales bacterium]
MVANHQENRNRWGNGVDRDVAAVSCATIESLLQAALDGSLGQRIAEAALMAARCHAGGEAHEIQSPVEAEDSAT